MAIKEEGRIEPTAAPDPYDDEPEEELEEEEAPRRRSGRVLPIIVASLAIVGFVVIVYYAYQQGIRAGSEANPPLIKAEDGPAKVRPAAPGGMDVPNQNMKVYELGRPGAQSAAAGPERILPRPEEPMQRPAAPQGAPQAAAAPAAAPALPVAGAPASPGPQAASDAVVTPPPPPLPGSGQPMAAPAPTMAEVQTVLTPPARQSNLAVPPPPPPPPRSALVPGGRAPATASSMPPLSTGDATAQAAPPPAIPRSATGPRVSAAPGAAGAGQQAPAAAAPAAAPAATGATAGPARVQLMAAQSPEAAALEAKKFATRFPDLLGNLKNEVERFDNPNDGKTHFRVLFGPLGSRADAIKLCESLKAQKQNCLVR